MSHGHFLRAIKEWGVGGTFKQLYKMRTLKFGRLVGVDKYGNKYFENTDDYPHGQHRWVELSGEKNFYEVDAAAVPAEWHGWLHAVTDEPPTDKTTGSTWRTPPQANAHNSSAIYKRNLGGVISAHTPNMSSYRPRGYGLGNGIDSKPNEELFYTQPGYPLDKRNSARRVSRAERLGFSLRDTPATITAKAAGRAGLSAEEYERFSHPESSTRSLLILTEGDMTPAEKEAATASGNALLAEAVAGLPTDEAKRALAVRVASGTGHARPWGAELEKGTFAAARCEVLSKDEEAFLEEGWEEDELLNRIAQYQAYVEGYETSSVKSAAAGVDKARAIVEDCNAKLAKLRGINAKLAALEAKFDARAVAQAANRQQQMQ